MSNPWDQKTITDPQARKLIRMLRWRRYQKSVLYLILVSAACFFFFGCAVSKNMKLSDVICDDLYGCSVK